MNVRNARPNVCLVVVRKGHAHFPVTGRVRQHSCVSDRFVSQTQWCVQCETHFLCTVSVSLSLLLKRFPWMLSGHGDQCTSCQHGASGTKAAQHCDIQGHIFHTARKIEQILLVYSFRTLNQVNAYLNP